jgi:hypothetical protein
LVTIDTVIAEHMKTVADPESASIIIRGTCERRALLGISGSSDPVQLSIDAKAEDSTAAFDRAFKMIEGIRRLQAEKPSGAVHEPSDKDSDKSS